MVMAIALLAFAYRFALDAIQQVERDAARQRILESHHIGEYDRELLGDEADELLMQAQGSAPEPENEPPDR